MIVLQPYLTIGGKLIPAYGVLIIIGCICALGLILYRATRHAVSREDALYAWLFGVIGPVSYTHLDVYKRQT